MKKVFFIILFLFSINIVKAQDFASKNIEINTLIEGTLLEPNPTKTKTLVIIIAGSGPTNRDGNQKIGKNNSLKQLAYFLADKGFASFRYDKRIFKLAKDQLLDESKLRFDDFVQDATDVVNYFKLYHQEEYKYEKIILLGHSQGALVAQLASLKTAVNALVLICGTAKPLDKVLVSQLHQQAPFLTQDLKVALDSIKRIGYVKTYNPLLKTLLREEVQAFIHSWMKYDPIAIAKMITEPTLVVGGTTDIQIPWQDAELLAENLQKGKSAVITDMNHVLKTIKDVGLENQKSYSNPNLPLSEQLKKELDNFLKDFK